MKKYIEFSVENLMSQQQQQKRMYTTLFSRAKCPMDIQTAANE